MPYFVGLDASKRTTKICVMDPAGAVVKEGVTASEPKEIVAFLRGERRRYVTVGLESWSLAPTLHAGLSKAGLPAVMIEALHAHHMLKARRNKTDRNDARGIADLMRTGQFRPVHVKSSGSVRLRSLLTARAILVRKAADLQIAVGAMLLCGGQKLTAKQRKTFDRRAEALTKAAGLAEAIHPLLEARRLILAQAADLSRELDREARENPVTRRLMTAPGVGPMTALAFMTTIDDPSRFAHSRDVGPFLGLVPRVRQSGESEVYGKITHAGDAATRTALFLSATVLLRSNSRPSWLKTWGRRIALERGRRKGAIAVARRLAIVMHRMWIDETDFQWEREPAALNSRRADAETAGGVRIGRRGQIDVSGAAHVYVGLNQSSKPSGRPRWGGGAECGSSPA